MTNTTTTPRATVLGLYAVAGGAYLLTVLFADGTRGTIRGIPGASGGPWWLESASFEKYALLRDLLDGAAYA